MQRKKSYTDTAGFQVGIAGRDQERKKNTKARRVIKKEESVVNRRQEKEGKKEIGRNGMGNEKRELYENHEGSEIKEALDGMRSIKNACLFSQQGQGQRCRDANMHTHKGTKAQWTGRRPQRDRQETHQAEGQGSTERNGTKGCFMTLPLYSL